MSSDNSKSRKKSELPSIVTVPSSWAVTQYGKGRLQLSPAQIKQLETSDTIKIPRKQFEDVSAPLPPKSPIEWIEPLDAVHWLAARMGSDVAAKTAIAERLRDGAVDCSHVWMSEGPDIGPVSDSRPKFPVPSSGETRSPRVTPIRDGKNPSKTGNAFWLYSDNWDADLKRWNWSTGLFVVSRNDISTLSVDGIPKEELKSEVRSRMIAAGVRFDRKDIEKIGYPESRLDAPTEIQSETSQPNRKGVGGAPPKVEHWTAFWQAIIQISQDGRLNKSSFQSRTELRQEILEMINHGLSDTSIKPHVRQIWKRFIEPR